MDNELLEEIHIVNNHSPATVKIYKQSVKKYTKFFSMGLAELLEEVEAEEKQGIRWKKGNEVAEYSRVLLCYPIQIIIHDNPISEAGRTFTIE